jgi:hypothetical protein
LEEVRPYDEKKELLLITRGNEEAYTVFYNRYRSKIYGVALNEPYSGRVLKGQDRQSSQRE